VRPALFLAVGSANGAPGAAAVRAFSGFGNKKTPFAAAPQKVFFGFSGRPSKPLAATRRSDRNRARSLRKTCAWLF
jgi:hypothetical protein